MKTMKKRMALFLVFSLVGMLVSCGGNGEDMTQTTETPISPEDKITAENQAFLDTVTYLDYVLTGEEEPYFVGRWFEKKIGGVKHHVTLTDGSAFYFMTDGAESFDVNFTVITEKEEPYFAYSIDGANPIRQHITDQTVRLPDGGKHTVRIIADGMT